MNKPDKMVTMTACLLYGMFATIFSCSKSDEPQPEAPSSTHTFYVATTGSDANPGTFDAPFKTINAGIGKIAAGDTLLVHGGTYIEKISFPKSGTTDRPICVNAFPNETPVIDGTPFTVTGKEALVTIRNAKFIVLEGFDIRNFKSTTPWVNVNGILVDGTSGNVTIRKNKIYNIEHNVTLENGRSGHGIEIIGNTGTAIKNILVEENVIHDCNTGYSENLTINGYVDGFIIRNNVIYNAENIGIDAAGGYSANTIPQYNYARNGIIAGNELYNIENQLGPLGGYGAIAIYVDGARNIIVERNKVHDSDRGIGIVSETDAYPTENCVVRNNFVYNCWRTGIYLGGYLNYTTGGTKNCFVVNNTLFQNNKVLGYFDEVEGEIRLTENCFDNTISNNVIYARSENDVFVHKYTTTGSGNVIDHNLYYSPGTVTWIWNGTSYTDFNEWKLASGADASSTLGVDPLLVSTSTPDLHIQSDSPAKNTGQVISADVNGSVDIDGNDRIVGNKISKGAQQ